MSRGASRRSQQQGARTRHSSEALTRRKSSRRHRASSAIPIVDPLSFKPSPPKKKLLNTPWAKYGRPAPQKRERNLARLPSEDLPENLDLIDKTLDNIYKVIVGAPPDTPGGPPSSIRGGQRGGAGGPHYPFSSAGEGDNERQFFHPRAIGNAREEGAPLNRTPTQIKRQVLNEAAKAFATGRPPVTRRRASHVPGAEAPGGPQGQEGARPHGMKKGPPEGAPFSSDEEEEDGRRKGPLPLPSRGKQAMMKRGKITQLSDVVPDLNDINEQEGPPKEKGGPKGGGARGAPKEEGPLKQGGDPFSRGDTLKAMGTKPLDLTKVLNKHAKENVPKLSPEELKQLEEEEGPDTSDDEDEGPFFGRPPRGLPVKKGKTPAAPPQRGPKEGGASKGASVGAQKKQSIPKGGGAPKGGPLGGGPLPPPPSRQSLEAIPAIPTEGPPGGPSLGGGPPKGGPSAEGEEEPPDAGGAPKEETGGPPKEEGGGKSWWAPLLQAPLLGIGLGGEGAPEATPEGAPPTGREPLKTPKAADKILRAAQGTMWNGKNRNNNDITRRIAETREQQMQQQQKLQQDQQQQQQHQRQQNQKQQQVGPLMGTPLSQPQWVGAPQGGPSRGPPPPPPSAFLPIGGPPSVTATLPAGAPQTQQPPFVQPSPEAFVPGGVLMPQGAAPPAPMLQGAPPPPRGNKGKKKAKEAAAKRTAAAATTTTTGLTPETGIYHETNLLSPSAEAEIEDNTFTWRGLQGPPPQQTHRQQTVLMPPVPQPAPPGVPTGPPGHSMGAPTGAPTGGPLAVPLVPLKGYPGAIGNFEGLWRIWMNQEEALHIGEMPPGFEYKDEGFGGPQVLEDRMPMGPLYPHEEAATGAPEARGMPQGPPEAYTVAFKAKPKPSGELLPYYNQQGSGCPLVYEVLKEGPLDSATASGGPATAQGTGWGPYGGPYPSMGTSSLYPSVDPADPFRGGAGGPIRGGGNYVADPFGAAVRASQGFDRFWDLMQKHTIRSSY